MMILMMNVQYLFGHWHSLTHPFPLQLLSDIRSLQQEQVSHVSVDIGTAVKTVVADAFGSNVRPLSAKMVIVITDKTSNNAQMVAVRRPWANSWSGKEATS